METLEITIERRSDQGKGPMRRLRARGKVPAILYGPKRTTTAVAVSAEEFERKLTHLEGAHLIRLVEPAGTDADLHARMVLVRDLQLDPLTGRALHADFYEVDLTERITVAVTLHFVGKPAGVVNGGILQPILREVEVECLPTEIPDFIEVDVSGLDIHDAVHVEQLSVPEGVRAVGDPTRSVVTVLPPSVETKPGEVAAEGAAAVPEGGTAAPSTDATKKTES